MTWANTGAVSVRLADLSIVLTLVLMTPGADVLGYSSPEQYSEVPASDGGALVLVSFHSWEEPP